MATIQEYEKLTTQERRLRYFSEEFRRKKVSEIERNLTTVSEVSREYQVSKAAIYVWINRYSRMRKKRETGGGISERYPKDYCAKGEG